ncbi:MAG TPA: DUF721 domain-containing protein [Candidatus Angelobacter sp.]|nr:DUF721 domain-containing protein [Candidatus Angelobacter sp.]
MEAVRTGLRQIMQELLRVRPADEAVLLAWPMVCGRDVAARTQASSFSEGTLFVAVSDATWRSQLQSFTSRYISGYGELLGPLVHDIRFEIKPSAISHQAQP